MKVLLAAIALSIPLSAAALESVTPLTMYRDEYLGDKQFYWNGNKPCTDIAAYLDTVSARLFDYNNPRYNVDPTYGPGCRYDLIARAGSGYPVGTALPNWFAQNWVEPVSVCPDDYAIYDDYTVSPSRKRCARPALPPVTRPPCCDDGYNTGPTTAGDPINFGIGHPVQIDTDYAGLGDDRLNFQRFLRTGLWPYLRSKIGANWNHSFSRELFYVGATAVHPIGISDPSGFWTWFKPSGSTFISIYHPADTITKVILSGGAYEWHRHKPNDNVEVYDSAGRNTRIETREGHFLTLAYDAQGRLASVDNEYGRGLDFIYGANDSISRINLPDGNALTYEYSIDTPPRLLAVHYPGGTKKGYGYDGGGRLTSVTDENGVAYEIIKYNPYGKAIETALPGGVNRYAYTGVAANELPHVYGNEGTTGSYNLLTPLGLTVRIDTVNVNGTVLPAAVSSACPECGVDGSAFTYDANGAVLSKADFTGKKVCYSYDTARNLETAHVNGILVSESCSAVLANLPTRADVTRISTQWHGVWRQPIKIAEPYQITTYAYNGDGGVYCAPASAKGVLCRETSRDTTDASGRMGLGAPMTGLPRVWQHTYDSFGHELTLIDPNGVVTTKTYSNGNLSTDSGSAGKMTVTAYDANGRPLAFHDANNVTTTLTYWPRGWLHTIIHAGSSITFTYDNAGQLIKVLFSDGTYVRYTYDSAHRLIQQQDHTLRKIVYTLDALGNRIGKATYDATGKRLQAVDERRTDSALRLPQVERPPLNFIYYGFWCGPNWTGGFNREFGEPTPKRPFLPPIDALDTCCYIHDICYWKCRCAFGCSESRRKSCMITCDRTLASCAADTGSPYMPLMWLWFTYGTAFPGPDSSTCSQQPTTPAPR